MAGDSIRPGEDSLTDADVGLGRDEFFRSMLRGLTGTIEEVVGLDEAAGFVSVVGDEIGSDLDERYRAALQVDRLDPETLAGVLVDLKRRIGGDFYVIEHDDERIVLGNRACPFGDKVLGRPSLCMMTSNVFGSIAAGNSGYAKVDLQETIAQGDRGCRVVVHLQPSEDAGAALGREYFGDHRQATSESDEVPGADTSDVEEHRSMGR